MKIVITRAQYSALDKIYGPPANVHSLIMTASMREGKVILEDEDEVFEELLNLISQEISLEFCSKKDAKALLAVCKKIDPESLDWIGC